MSESERNEIIYEEGWRRKAPDDREPAEKETPPDPPPAAGPRPLLISIRLVLCAAAALVLFLLRTMDSPAYHGFMAWYRDGMSRTLIGREFFGSDNSGLPATADEVTVTASPDALPPR